MSVSVRSSMNFSICRTKVRAILYKPWRIDFRVIKLKHASTLLSQDPPLGVKRKCTPECDCSHALTAGVVRVEELPKMKCAVSEISLHVAAAGCILPP